MSDATPRESSLSFTITNAFARNSGDRHYEPIPSTRLYSVKEMQRGKRPEYIWHRFNIPGGISYNEIVHRQLLENVAQNNTAMQRLMEGRVYP